MKPSNTREKETLVLFMNASQNHIGDSCVDSYKESMRPMFKRSEL